ncbi:hypothetical protein [Aquimarina sp. AU58]|uniref:hypothetical protein n=1 Tax=Aquimarina sp. AU58 TaxID=1874112 RepID=UPI000D652390|nr:hypothetical protein [Aquimarina sp. AU58]
MEEKSFNEIWSILKNLNSYQTKDEIDALVSDFDFDMIRERGLLMLAKMVIDGDINAIQYLLKKGVNVNLTSSEPYYRAGPALLFALQNNISSVSKKCNIIRLLIDYGSDIDATVKWYTQNQETELTGNYIEYGIALGEEHHKIVNNASYDAESRRSSKKEVQDLQVLLSLIKDLGINLNTNTAKNLHNFLNIDTKTTKKVDTTKFLKEALLELTVKDRVYDLPSVAKEICYSYLENESFIPSKEWAELIKHLVKISLTFEEVSKYVYEGEIVSFMDDEGWLSQSWEEYNWFSELTAVLANENALKNPEWDSLLLLIIKECTIYDAESIDEQIEEILKEPWVQSHKSFQKLKATANQYLY